MIHTLAHYRGACISRLQGSGNIPAAALDLEINNAVQEVWNKVRAVHSEVAFEQATDKLLANINIYPLPRNCSDLLMVERMDVGELAVPMVAIPFQTSVQQRWLGGGGSSQPYTYQRLPGSRILLIQMPTASVDPGLRYTYTPSSITLSRPEDFPSFPESIHECVIPLATKRLSQYAGVQLANPQAFLAWERDQERVLDSYLQPSNTEGGNQILDFDPYFTGGTDDMGWF